MLTANITLDILSDDFDNDGIFNENDNCPDTANPDQSDLDDDGICDVCDPNPIPQNTFTLCKQLMSHVNRLTMEG